MVGRGKSSSKNEGEMWLNDGMEWEGGRVGWMVEGWEVGIQWRVGRRDGGWGSGMGGGETG